MRPGSATPCSSQNVVIDIYKEELFPFNIFHLNCQFSCFFSLCKAGGLLTDEGELGWAPASHLEPTDNGAEITTSKVFAPGKGKFISVKLTLLMDFPSRP